MTKVIDVRDTYAAEKALEEMIIPQFGSIAHVMATAYTIRTKGTLPEGWTFKESHV